FLCHVFHALPPCIQIVDGNYSPNHPVFAFDLIENANRNRRLSGQLRLTGYHTYVATEPLFKFVWNDLPSYRTANFCGAFPSFTTTSTVLPPGTVNATSRSPAGSLDAILTDPGRTNLEK